MLKGAHFRLHEKGNEGNVLVNDLEIEFSSANVVDSADRGTDSEDKKPRSRALMRAATATLWATTGADDSGAVDVSEIMIGGSDSSDDGSDSSDDAAKHFGRGTPATGDPLGFMGVASLAAGAPAIWGLSPNRRRYLASCALAWLRAKPAAQPMKPPTMCANCEMLSAVRPFTTSRPM